MWGRLWSPVMSSHASTHTPSGIHTPIRVCTFTHTCTCMYAHSHIHACMHIDTYIRVCTFTHTCMYAHSHTRACMWQLIPDVWCLKFLCYLVCVSIEVFAVVFCSQPGVPMEIVYNKWVCAEPLNNTAWLLHVACTATHKMYICLYTLYGITRGL